MKNFFVMLSLFLLYALMASSLLGGSNGQIWEEAVSPFPWRIFIIFFVFEIIIFNCFWQYKKNYSYAGLAQILAVLHLLSVPFFFVSAPSIIVIYFATSAPLLVSLPFCVVFFINVFFSVVILIKKSKINKIDTANPKTPN